MHVVTYCRQNANVLLSKRRRFCATAHLTRQERRCGDKTSIFFPEETENNMQYKVPLRRRPLTALFHALYLTRRERESRWVVTGRLWGQEALG